MPSPNKILSLYPDESLLEKLNNFKTEHKHKSLNAAAIAILEQYFNGNVESTVLTDDKFNSMIADAIKPLNDEITKIKKALSLIESSTLPSTLESTLLNQAKLSKESNVKSNVDDNSESNVKGNVQSTLNNTESTLKSNVQGTSDKTPLTAEEALKLAQSRGYKGNTTKSLTDGFDRDGIGERFKLRRVKKGKSWTYFDNLNT